MLVLHFILVEETLLEWVQRKGGDGLAEPFSCPLQVGSTTALPEVLTLCSVLVFSYIPQSKKCM